MPIYEYRCPICHHIIERIEHNYIPAHSLAPYCLKCGRAMGRIVSVPAAPQFKGSGFHAIDYKDKK